MHTKVHLEIALLYKAVFKRAEDLYLQYLLNAMEVSNKGRKITWIGYLLSGLRQG